MTEDPADGPDSDRKLPRQKGSRLLPLPPVPAFHSARSTGAGSLNLPDGLRQVTSENLSAPLHRDSLSRPDRPANEGMTVQARERDSLSAASRDPKRIFLTRPSASRTKSLLG